MSPTVIVVTGASSGIGRATALACARQGHNLVLAARSRQKLRRTELDCSAYTGGVLVHPVDVTDGEAVEGLLDAARARFGRVDAVVHAAAVIAYGRVVDVPPEIFDAVLRTNVLGTANVARSSLKRFEEQGSGHLVLIGSLLGNVAVPFMGSYVTGKWAVHGLARVLQMEARSMDGVHVSLVSPAGVDTPIYRAAGNYLGRVAKAPPPVDSPQKVARSILAVLARPRRQRRVGIANRLVELGFRGMPAVFDVLVSPLMRTLALTREPVDPHEGNVRRASADVEDELPVEF